MRLFPNKNAFAIKLEAPGRLVYLERNSEFVFPVYESNREWILVETPTFKRIFLFFGWYRVPFKFSGDERARILPRLLQYLRADRQPARVFDRGDTDTRSFCFYPELFDHRANASDTLADAGLEWMTTYGSIDLLHEEYGLEVCGIHQKADVELIGETLREAFPHWHYSSIGFKDYGREPGWKFRIHMFARECGGGRAIDAES